MKRREFIRELIDAGCYLKRRGKKHDIYVNPRNEKKAPVPRHREIIERKFFRQVIRLAES